MNKTAFLFPFLLAMACNDAPDPSSPDNSVKGQNKDYCLSAKILAQAQADGTYQQLPCIGICTNGMCKQGGTITLEESCKFSDPPSCYADTVVLKCDTDLYGDMEDEINGRPIVAHCQAGYKCQDGYCVLRDENTKCVTDYCKDINTLVKCSSGISQETACSEGQLCLADKCQNFTGVKSCQNSDQCADDEICQDNLCYTKSNMDIALGSPCDASTFQEYCLDGVEIKCGYDGVVERNDCTPYNGCTMLVKKAYRSDMAIRNAICRGNTEDLVQCQIPGTVSHQCLNYTDTEYGMSFYYSLTNTCDLGTNGQLVYQQSRDEENCGSAMCNIETGLCND